MSIATGNRYIPGCGKEKVLSFNCGNVQDPGWVIFGVGCELAH